MKNIYFYSPTLLSPLDLTTIGGSEKAGDDSKYGKFSSGLKYATALFLRSKVEMSIQVIDDLSETNYTVSTYTKNCTQTDKVKELIKFCANGVDIETGFSPKLGVDWALWMALREIYSNMVDEGGWWSESPIPTFQYGTVTILSFDEDNPFYEIWQNKHLYINEIEPLFEISSKVDVLDNSEGFLRIYKQNILVYSDEKRPSRYAYNIKFGEIDERRILSNIYSVESEIINAIRYTNNEEFLRTIITKDFKSQENEFITGQTVYGEAMDLAHNIAKEVFEEYGEVRSYSWMMSSITKRKDCGIVGRVIKSVGDSLWTYSTDVKVMSAPQTFSEPDIEVEEVTYQSTFSAEIAKLYNFKLDCEVKKANLKGSTVIADKFNKCLIIDESFDLEKDFSAFIVEYLDLTREGNVVKNLGEYITEILKK